MGARPASVGRAPILFYEGNTMRKIILLALVCLPLFSETPTRVQQTLIDASGNKESGQLTITWPNFVTPGSVIVSAGKMNVPIANGVLSVPLYPTVGATPTGVAYTVTVVVGTGPATSTSSEIWGVPASVTPVTRQSVILTQIPSINTSVMWSQMAQGGATDGQVMGWNNSSGQWLPITPELQANKGVAGGYAELDGSALIPQAEIPTEINANKVANGTVSNAQYQYLSGVTGAIQTQINSKMNLGTVVYADANCTTPGTYDDTCLTNAEALLPSTGGVIRLGERTYTLNNTVTFGKIGTYLAGVEGASTLRLANSINKDLLLLNTCHNCVINGVTFDGNRTNQTGASHLLNVTNSTQVTVMHNHFLNGYDYGIWISDNIVFDSNNFDYTDYGVYTIFLNQFDGMGSSAIATDTSSTVGLYYHIIGNHFNRNGVTSYLNGSIVTLQSTFTADVEFVFNEASMATFGSTYMLDIDAGSPGGFLFGNAMTGGVHAIQATNGGSISGIALNIPTSNVSSFYYVKAVGCNGGTAFQILNTTDAATMVCTNTSGVSSQGGMLLPTNGYYLLTDQILASLGSGSFSALGVNSFSWTIFLYGDNSGSQSGVVYAAYNVDVSCSVPTGSGNNIAITNWTNLYTQLQIGMNMSTFANKTLQLTLISWPNITAGGECAGLGTYAGMVLRITRVSYTGANTAYTGGIYFLGYQVKVLTQL
jgi:hypothetical protein